jgi:hypothetical protein
MVGCEESGCICVLSRGIWWIEGSRIPRPSAIYGTHGDTESSLHGACGGRPLTKPTDPTVETRLAKATRANAHLGSRESGVGTRLELDLDEAPTAWYVGGFVFGGL